MGIVRVQIAFRNPAEKPPCYYSNQQKKIIISTLFRIDSNGVHDLHNEDFDVLNNKKHFLGVFKLMKANYI